MFLGRESGGIREVSSSREFGGFLRVSGQGVIQGSSSLMVLQGIPCSVRSLSGNLRCIEGDVESFWGSQEDLGWCRRIQGVSDTA